LSVIGRSTGGLLERGAEFVAGQLDTANRYVFSGRAIAIMILTGNFTCRTRNPPLPYKRHLPLELPGLVFEDEPPPGYRKLSPKTGEVVKPLRGGGTAGSPARFPSHPPHSGTPPDRPTSQRWTLHSTTAGFVSLVCCFH